MRPRNTDKEEQVKRTAIRMIVEDGYDGFSMNKLAKFCGISVGTLYIYYKDKDDLLRRLGVEVSKNFITQTLLGFTPDMPFREGLKKQWENRARYAINFPTEVACHEIMRHTPYADYIFENSIVPFKDAMSSFFCNAVKRGEIVSLSLETYWSIAYGTLHFLLRFHKEGKNIAGQPFIYNDHVRDEAFELVIKALTPP